MEPSEIEKVLQKLGLEIGRLTVQNKMLEAQLDTANHDLQHAKENASRQDEIIGALRAELTPEEAPKPKPPAGS